MRSPRRDAQATLTKIWDFLLRALGVEPAGSHLLHGFFPIA
jgi:hypothetical protein